MLVILTIQSQQKNLTYIETSEIEAAEIEAAEIEEVETNNEYFDGEIAVDDIIGNILQTLLLYAYPALCVRS